MLRTTRTRGSDGGASDLDSDRNDERASPASRLRAAMSRLGGSSPPSREPAIASTSETESDPDPVFSARRSLKDVFSRAMREPEDSYGSKSIASKSGGGVEAEVCSQASDSSLPLSNQAVSLQLLRQRLEIPEMSSRFDASRSLNKPSRSQQTLSHLLQAEETDDHEDSLDTARPTSPPKVVDQSLFGKTSSPTAPISSLDREFATPRQETPSNTELVSRTPKNRSERPNGTRSDGEDENSMVPNVLKTPHHPGGWFTPVRQVDPPSQSLSNTRTPAPPGAWQNTPSSSLPRKGILKNTVPSLEQIEHSSVEDISEDDTQPPKKAVTLVDSYGRERKFDENGKEMVLPPVAALLEHSPPRKPASVRVVDSLGNEVIPSLAAPPDLSSDIEQAGPDVNITKIGAKISAIKEGLERVEMRQFSLQTRRTVSQDAVPHERILQLAMDSREARIEREKLLRQNHLVRSRQKGLPSIVGRMTNSSSMSIIPGHLILANRWLFVLILLSNLILWCLFYFSAHAYVRHYFLTSYYDPFFAIIDPSNLYRIPFIRLTLLPSRWMAFDATSTKLAVLNLFSGYDGFGRSVLTLISKPLVASEIKLPS